MRHRALAAVLLPAAAALVAVVLHGRTDFAAAPVNWGAFTLPLDAATPVQLDCEKWTFSAHKQLHLLQPLRYTGQCRWELRREEGQEDASPKAPWVKETCRIRHSFWRSVTAPGDEIDIVQSPHTLSAFARVREQIRQLYGRASVDWCMRDTPYMGCRKCGYSCAQFSNVPPANFNVTYPLRAGALQVRVISPVQQKGMGHGAAPPPGVTPEVPIHLYKTANNPLATTTAFYQGWRIQQSKGKMSTRHCKGRPSSRPTIWMSSRKHADLIRGNVGHWLHDVLFPLFNVVHHRMDLLSDKVREYDVVPGDNFDNRHWRKEWAVGALGYMVDSLAPRRVKTAAGQCYHEAYFDCPAANTMEPVRPFQEWLRKRHGLSFSPVPLTSAPRMVLFVRRPGGSRFLVNWQRMVAVAQAMGFVVDVPLRPDEEHGFISHEMKRVLPLLQRAHVVVGAHGAELSTMLFAPNNSAVVEITPIHFRYLDLWYVRQAEASGLHLIRWSPPSGDFSISRTGRRKVKGSQQRWEMKMLARYEKSLEEGKLSEFAVRSLQSNITVGERSWRAVLDLARELVAGGAPATAP